MSNRSLHVYEVACHSLFVDYPAGAERNMWTDVKFSIIVCVLKLIHLAGSDVSDVIVESKK